MSSCTNPPAISASAGSSPPETRIAETLRRYLRGASAVASGDVDGGDFGVDSGGRRRDAAAATAGGAPRRCPMEVRGTPRVRPVVFMLLATLVGGTSLARAADDLIPPTLPCVDGLFTRSPGGHGRLRRRRWLCDVDGQVNGACTFGRRCRPCFGCPGIRTRCRVTVSLRVGEQRQEGRVTLACASSGTSTPCGPASSCDTVSEMCVAREPVGPPIVYACAPVPAGCESDRSCRCAGASLCQGAFSTCADVGPNSVDCTCPLCQ
jgi:hypothetical protein